METIIDHKKIKILTNFVLVKAHKEMLKYHLNGKETSILVGHSSMKYSDPNDSLDFEMHETVDTHAHHWPISGEVIAVPDKNVFNGHLIHNEVKGLRGEDIDSYIIEKNKRMSDASLEINSPLEVQVGDEVFFDYMMTSVAYDNGHFLNTDIGDLVLIRYDKLIGRVRNGEIYPLNSNIFFEWDKPKKIGSFDLPDKNIYDVEDIQEGVINYVGLDFRYYLEGAKFIDMPTSFSVGDRILFEPCYCSLIESEFHLRIFGGKEVYTISRRNILAIKKE